MTNAVFGHARPFTEEEHAELNAYREGACSIAFDPISRGRELHFVNRPADERSYHVQETHRGQPVWHCAVCARYTVGGGADDPCVGCGNRDLNYVLSAPLACKSWSPDLGGGYPGICLIAGSDGCECPDGVL